MPGLHENFFVGLSGKNKPFFSKKLRKMKKNLRCMKEFLDKNLVYILILYIFMLLYYRAIY
jgi:hypothetical protein